MSRNAAPRRVAINSPCAITRARRRSLTSPTSAMPAAIWRRRLNCSSRSGVGDDAEIAREIAMALLDLFHDGLPFAAERERQQLLEPVGDARQGGMHDDRP